MSEIVSLRRIILDPLLRALKSRQVLIALSAVVVALLVMALPELEAVRGELLTLVVSLALALIGGYSLSDAARIARERNGASSDELRELVKQLLIELIEELGAEQRGEAEAPQENVNV
jgi:hypothetical protein